MKKNDLLRRLREGQERSQLFKSGHRRPSQMLSGLASVPERDAAGQVALNDAL